MPPPCSCARTNIGSARHIDNTAIQSFFIPVSSNVDFVLGALVRNCLAGFPLLLARAVFLPHLLGTGKIPSCHLFFGFFLCDSVALLNFADQALAFASNDVDVVVREFSPLLPHSALHLRPLTFGLFPIHKAIASHKFVSPRHYSQSRARRLR